MCISGTTKTADDNELVLCFEVNVSTFKFEKLLKSVRDVRV